MSLAATEGPDFNDEFDTLVDMLRRAVAVMKHIKAKNKLIKMEELNRFLSVYELTDELIAVELTVLATSNCFTVAPKVSFLLLCCCNMMLQQLQNTK